MKSIKSYIVAVGAVVLLSGSLWAKTPQIIEDLDVVLRDIQNDATKVRENAQAKKWGQALWHAEDSDSGRKMMVGRLFEPNAADFGTAEAAQRLDVYKRVADFMKKFDAVFERQADMLKRLASQDIIAFKAYSIDKRFNNLKEALVQLRAETDYNKISELVRQYKLDKFFTAAFMERMKTVKKAFVAQAQKTQDAIAQGVEQLKAALKKEEATGRKIDLIDALETYD